MLGNFSLSAYRRKRAMQEQAAEEDAAIFQEQLQQEQAQAQTRRSRDQPFDFSSESEDGEDGTPKRKSYGAPKQLPPTLQQWRREREAAQAQQEAAVRDAPPWLYVSHQVVVPLVRLVACPPEGRCVAMSLGAFS